MDKRWCVISPVYNDWECANSLLSEIRGLSSLAIQPVVFFVDDGSNSEPAAGFENEACKVIRLTRNLGHQKAIAIALSKVETEFDFDFVVVMDSDGEDRPRDITLLINQYNGSRGESVVFAHRKRRHEGLLFKSLYYVYRMLFQILTNEKIAFGNFSLIPAAQLKRVVHISEIWNHFSGGIIRSKISYETIPVDRGKRYFGTSKMNFTALIIHGISSITVHLDVVAVRLLMMTLGAILFMLFTFAYVSIKSQFFMDMKTEIFVGSAAIIMSLSAIVLFIPLTLVFNVLFYRIQSPFIPKLKYTEFIVPDN